MPLMDEFEIDDYGTHDFNTQSNDEILGFMSSDIPEMEYLDLMEDWKSILEEVGYTLGDLRIENDAEIEEDDVENSEEDNKNYEEN